jgi:hypothetical protein
MSATGDRADAEARQAEIARLFALVRDRYGERLSAAELEGVRQGVEAVVDAARALRAVRLDEADEPMQPFVPYRADR